MLNDPVLQKKYDQQVAIWLISLAAVILGMIMLGGATRLTHSGLSMVEWKPLVGIIPPIGEQEWQAVFERYKEFPEYKIVNQGMTLEGFKSIFYYEYFHRALGRLIGLFFLIPALYFWFSGKVRRSMAPQLVTMFILGGLQGLLGWYMVKSGLVKDPMVSQYRLTAHLLTALLIYGYMLWVAFGLLKAPANDPPANNPATSDPATNDPATSDPATSDPATSDPKPLASNPLFKYSAGLTGLIVFMIMTGGFVAGTKAGFAYNTFPLMGKSFIPEGLYTLTPFWLNWFENLTTIQFNHRMIAYLLVLLIPTFCFALRRLGTTERSRTAAHWFLAMMIIQVSLGVATILLNVAVPVAVIHQGGAVLLFTIALYITRELKTETSNG